MDLPLYNHFIDSLKQIPFQGDISINDAETVLYSTDNSIYELKPFGVIFPKNQHDVELIFKILNQEKYSNITITARGGGTSTNGQSINTGFIVDYSRYMNKIININAEEKTVIVQPGVILDILNKELVKYGLFFPPNISPSNRATIGGMVNTDACGKGSCVYGRTSDYILDLTLHLVGESQAVLSSMQSEKLLPKIFPILNKAKEHFGNRQLVRTITGYNLEKSINQDGTLSLNYLISGSEGTLALVSEITLKLYELPAKKRIVLLRYKDFDNALADARNILTFKPSAIETVDEHVLQLARNDIIWQDVSHFIGDGNNTSINIMEFTYKSINEFESHEIELNTSFNQKKYLFDDYFIINSEKEIATIWNLRKQGVGLLGAMKGKRRPIPFIEDTIVPPENLAAYIKSFRKILEKYGVVYGMFGHVDAGCLHVRPALNMRQFSDRTLIRTITDEVANLLKEYDGILWGEHGKGFRGEYTETFLGKEIMDALVEIKKIFDPYNQLNPNKIAVVNGTLPKIDEITTRGQFDESIPLKIHDEFENILSCNGNALCYNFETNYVMCPSYKVTNNRVHSPKGRAMLFKEWVRRNTNLPSITQNFTLGFWKSLFLKVKNHIKPDFEKEVYESFAKCLGCKACNTQCPIKVSIPDAKSYFLSVYFTTHFRQLQDYAVANIEKILKILAISPKISNFLLQKKISKFFARKVFGIVDIPEIQTWKPTSHSNNGKKVVLLREAFTNCYHTNAMQSCYELLVKLGFNVSTSKIFENGKGLHVKGFLNQFRGVIKKNIEYFSTLNATLISIEPSLVLSYQDEYRRFSGDSCSVLFLPDFLVKETFSLNINTNKMYHLILHCSEQTNITGIGDIWSKLFGKFDLKLNIIKLGCCGMSGSFGNEVQNFEDSKSLFDSNWESTVTKLIKDSNNIVMVSGSSCKMQVERFMGTKLKNPFEVLNSLVN
jgi:FAD/FMN-containing dehydrogenase/Fe-S oxidoreductase